MPSQACELSKVCPLLTCIAVQFLTFRGALLSKMDWEGALSPFSLEGFSPSFPCSGETLASATGQSALKQQLLLKNKNFPFLSHFLKSFMPPKNNTQHNLRYSLRHFVLLLFLRRLRILRHEIPNKSQKQSYVIKRDRPDYQETEIDTTLLKSLEWSQLKLSKRWRTWAIGQIHCYFLVLCLKWWNAIFSAERCCVCLKDVKFLCTTYIPFI